MTRRTPRLLFGIRRTFPQSFRLQSFPCLWRALEQEMCRDSAEHSSPGSVCVFFVRNMSMAIVQCGCSSVNIRVTASPTPPKHQHLPPLSSGTHRMLQKKTHSADHSGFRGPSFTWGRRGESLRRACPSSYPPPRFDGVLDRRLLSPRLAFFLSP